MSYTLVQAGSSLQFVDTSGAVTTLTLPTGITLATDKPPRFAVFGRFTVMTNTPNRPITIDPQGVVRVLCPFPPVAPVSLSSGGAGGLTGNYKAKQTFVIRDTFGNIIAESDFGPPMLAPFAAVANTIGISDIQISPDTSSVTDTNIYRTLDSGEVYFLWKELDGNVVNDFNSDDLADLALSVFAAPRLGTPPDLTLAAEWRGRLWGVGRTDVDVLRYSEPGSMYSWPISNGISVPRLGADSRGVAGLIARRESLVVGRRNNIQQVTGTSDDDFRLIRVTDEAGIESYESVAVYKDTAFFLWKDGVYALDANGVRCISNDRVRSWFTKDDTFARDRFQYAVGMIDPVRLKYRLFLAAAGSVVNDRWIEYDLADGTWWGPHKTGAFTPVSAIVVTDTNDEKIPMIGSSSGFLWEEQSTATDDTATAIDFDVDTGFDAQGSANVDKYWGNLSVMGKVQSTGTVAITPRVGDTDAAAKLAMQYVMSAGRQLIGRLGVGSLLKLNFRHNVAGEPVEIYGYEIDDVHELGQR